MRPGTHRRNLVETLLGAQGNLIALSKLAETLRTDRKTVKCRIRWLIEQGAVKVTKKHKRPRSFLKKGPDILEIIYSVNRRKLMAVLRKPTRKQHSKWDSMWRVIRAYRRFSRDDLCQLAGASQSNARIFTKELRKAGYIREAKGTWEMVIDPGPNRPIPPAR